MAFDEPDDGDRGRPDVVNVGDLSDEEVAKLVRARRFRRRLKALAAVALATAAGTFLACSRMVTRPPADASSGADSGGGDSGRPAMDGGMDAATRDATVDADQHRDGMPVPDNLLE